MNRDGAGGSVTRGVLKRRDKKWRSGGVLAGRCLTLGLFAAAAMQGQQNQFHASVPNEAASPTPLALSLRDAIERGLKTNLGLLTSESTSESVRGQRMEALSALLPKLNARVSQTEQQLSLKTIGFNINIPGVSIPLINGPFHYTDVRALASWAAFDYSARKNYQVSSQNRRAAELSLMDARDLVVEATANAYLQIAADASRVEAIHSQVETSQALYDRAVDRQNAGTAAGIDVLRSRVELKQQQQRLLAQTNQFDKDKLTLGRVIGLPNGQDFNLAETAPYTPLTALTQDEAVQTALKQRADYQSQQARVTAAETAVKAAHGERYPTGNITADYGVVGPALNDSHGTFSIVASASVNLFDGGRISGEIVQARAALKQRRDELANLAADIAYQINTALLDIRTAADQVAVARDSLDLANETLLQARDRFSAGVSDNIEVVQAQESVASANDSVISALYAHNVAKVALARALGGAEQGIQKYLEVK